MTRDPYFGVSVYDRANCASGGLKVSRQDIDAYFSEVSKALDEQAWWEQQMRDLQEQRD